MPRQGVDNLEVLNIIGRKEEREREGERVCEASVTISATVEKQQRDRTSRKCAPLAPDLSSHCATQSRTSYGSNVESFSNLVLVHRCCNEVSISATRFLSASSASVAVCPCSSY